MNLKEEYVELVSQYKDIIFKVCYIYAEKDEPAYIQRRE